MNLDRITGITKTSLDLLEATGFYDVESLAKADLDALVGEIEKANSVLKITEHQPGRDEIAAWIGAARDLAADSESFEDFDASADPVEHAPVELAVGEVNYELSPQVKPLLSAAPFALPLPARVLMKSQLKVAEIPSGILLNRYTGDLEVKLEGRVANTRQPQAVPNTHGNVRLADSGGQRLKIDLSKIRSTEDLREPLADGSAAIAPTTKDRHALLRAPSVAINEGLDPASRWYIRGLLHSHPFHIYFGAMVTMLLAVMFPASVITTTLLFLSSELPERFGWVPSWLLAVPVALPLCGIAYLIWGISGSCRICGQKLFVHRRHLKNSKAHHLPGLGYVVPLCFQILVFRWFRCTHCGTAVRLKE